MRRTLDLEVDTNRTELKGSIHSVTFFCADLDYNNVDASQILGRFDWNIFIQIKNGFIHSYFYSETADLTDVMEEIESLQSVYYPLGQSLRLDIADLKAIHDAYPNADQALEEVILLWLEKKYNVEKYGPPTWRMLVKAIDRKKGGNNHELAKIIASKYPSGS